MCSFDSRRGPASVGTSSAQSSVDQAGYFSDKNELAAGYGGGGQRVSSNGYIAQRNSR